MLGRTTVVMGLVLSAMLAACGGKTVDVGDDVDGGALVDADPNAPDADPNAPDANLNPDAAPLPPGCSTEAGASQCNNCLDDDNDGRIDGFDPECTGSADRDEGSFATGIPGDNRDAKKQDCFFDGNSGGGQDCAWHTCCLLDNPSTVENECPADLRQGYVAADCQIAQTQSCIRDCAPLTPPGCDCFGCCTVCEGDACQDILINPAVTPACDYSNLDACLTCTKNTQCGADDCEISETDCVLCPGQVDADLPDVCNGDNACPVGGPCVTDDQCGVGQYCSFGCCIGAVD